jgi:glutathionyl-hydroquinone reductase
MFSAVTVTSPHLSEHGWPFASVHQFQAADEDPLYGAKHVSDLYLRADPNYGGRCVSFSYFIRGASIVTTELGG